MTATVITNNITVINTTTLIIRLPLLIIMQGLFAQIASFPQRQTHVFVSNAAPPSADATLVAVRRIQPFVFPASAVALENDRMQCGSQRNPQQGTGRGIAKQPNKTRANAKENADAR